MTSIQKTPRLVAIGLLVLSLVGAWGSVVGADEPSPQAPSRDPVYVDAATLRYREIEPTQVDLVVRGSLPTPCHAADWGIVEGQDSLEVTLWSTQEPGTFCAAVLEPVELLIPIGAYESAGPDVRLNGEPVGRIGAGADLGEVTGLVGTGWSFGMCLGYCYADLRLDGDGLTLTGSDRESTDPIVVNRGELTADGRARLDAALAGLDPQALEPVYGCPDCADGGAAYLELSRDAGQSRHMMEFGAPPDELAGLDELAMSLITALETCLSDELVTVAVDCVAYEAG